ncbi:TolC family protein [Chondrinema litorale]|uniref:TolC family protein n=1 Tax=Chondrinema litorale TaxID=2994555 RepID=UPI00254280A8|nr:TolC family protein [Chondrinema litorale]UZR95021.1 TolC family protein [Chondrinema litorale]
MKYLLLKSYTLLSLLILFNLSAQAQESLSLSDAIQIGMANNYDIRIEEKTVDISENNNNWGEAGRYPTLDFQLQNNNSWRDVANPASFFQGTTQSNNINPIISLNWTLFDGFRANITKTRLARLQAESEGNAEIVIQNTIQSIILGYYTAVYEKERIEVLKTTLDVSRDRYEYIMLKKELGSAVTTDVLLEEGNYLTDSLNLINQGNVYRNAVRDLNILLGIEAVNQDYNFTDSLEFTAINYEYDNLYTKMTDSNADLRKEFITQAILKEDYRLAKADMYPTVSLGASYSYDRNRQDLSGSSILANNPDTEPISTARTTNTGINFTLTYNLFNGGKIQRAIKNAQINYDIGQLRTEDLKRSLSRDLVAEYDLYNNRLDLKGIAQRRKESAELNLSLSEEQFKTGTISSFDFRDVQINYLNYSLEDLQATYNLIESNISLLRLTGGIMDEATN